jgi:hypothetical protein
MGKLLEGFKILCANFDHTSEKNGGNYTRGDIIQGRILNKEIQDSLTIASCFHI